MPDAAAPALNGRRTLITGASGALGRAFALRLTRDGAVVVLHYHSNRDAAHALAEEISGNGGRAHTVAGDLSTVEGANNVVDCASETLGGLDVLINNAGMTRDTLLMRMRDDQWDDVINTNLRSAFACSRRAIRAMVRQRGGRIINVSSVVGLTGNAGQTNYAAAKAGLIGFTRALAREVASRGITVNAIAPGFVTSRLTDALSDDVRAELVSRIPLGRIATPEEVSGAVAFLASPDADYITGHVLTVDGGLTMI
jgi:3-oxoacyl-[acyl-carrier protein] reductase